MTRCSSNSLRIVFDLLVHFGLLGFVCGGPGLAEGRLLPFLALADAAPSIPHRVAEW
jgi:hypothetical protein